MIQWFNDVVLVGRWKGHPGFVVVFANENANMQTWWMTPHNSLQALLATTIIR